MQIDLGLKTLLFVKKKRKQISSWAKGKVSEDGGALDLVELGNFEAL